MSGPKGQLGEPLQVSLREVNGGLDHGHAAVGAVDEGIPVGVRCAGASEEAVPPPRPAVLRGGTHWDTLMTAPYGWVTRSWGTCLI